MKYDPDIGIFGMDIAIILKRAGGYRLPRRRIERKSIPKSIGIGKEETIKFLEENFNAQIVR